MSPQETCAQIVASFAFSCGRVDQGFRHGQETTLPFSGQVITEGRRYMDGLVQALENTPQAVGVNFMSLHTRSSNYGGFLCSRVWSTKTRFVLVSCLWKFHRE